MIDVGGRHLRVVRAGPVTDRPTIVLEHGAFGCASDWAVVQERLAAKGLASLAYDRAGLASIPDRSRATAMPSSPTSRPC